MTIQDGGSILNSENEDNEGQLFYYLRKFMGFKGFLGFIAAVYPVIGNFLGFDGKKLMPPLDYSYLIIYLILIVMVLLVVYSLKYFGFFEIYRWISTVVAITLFALAFLSFLEYVYWQNTTIRCGQVQPENSKPITYCVIIGLERSEFAKQNYKGKTDEEMLRFRGWTSEQVRVLWTPKTIKKGTVRVIGYFLIIPLLLLGIVGVLVLRECIDDNWGNN